MNKSSNATVTLSNGIQMPLLGLGVLHIPDGEEVVRAVQFALEAGYRSIDTATVYKNEEGVGAALARVDIPRNDIFLTTKVWNRDQGYQSTLKAFKESLKRLNTEYIDLYLIHWPGPDPAKYRETWRALETIYKAGEARSIGVSNFQPHHLEQVLVISEIPPMVNQVEFHPQLQQPQLVRYCTDHGIQVEAWRPIMKGEVANIQLLRELSAKYGKTPVQIALRWIIQQGIVAIPKSENENRIHENTDIFDFSLDEGDMDQIRTLDTSRRLGPDPDTYELDF